MPLERGQRRRHDFQIAQAKCGERSPEALSPSLGSSPTCTRPRPNEFTLELAYADQEGPEQAAVGLPQLKTFEGRWIMTGSTHNGVTTMKTISKFALLAGLAFVPSAALAQTSLTLDSGVDLSVSSGTTGSSGTNTSTSGSSSTSASFDINADGSLSVEELAELQAALEGSGNGDLVIDANGDGRISAEEAAAVTAALSGNAQVGTDIDADGDGLFNDDELTAAASAGSVACGDSGLGAFISALGDLDESQIATASVVRVVLVSDCDKDEVSAALAAEGATNIRQLLDANAAVTSAVQARGATMADVVGAATSGNMLVVFVAAVQTSAG